MRNASVLRSFGAWDATRPSISLFRLTLRLREFLLVNTRLNGSVELRVECSWRRVGNVVVCLYILFDGLAAVQNAANQSPDQTEKSAT